MPDVSQNASSEILERHRVPKDWTHQSKTMWLESKPSSE